MDCFCILDDGRRNQDAIAQTLSIAARCAEHDLPAKATLASPTEAQMHFEGAPQLAVAYSLSTVSRWERWPRRQDVEALSTPAAPGSLGPCFFDFSRILELKSTRPLAAALLRPDSTTTLRM